MNDNKKTFSVISECTEYFVKENEDGSVDIHMHVPKRFTHLVRAKLESLEADMDDVAYYDYD